MKGTGRSSVFALALALIALLVTGGATQAARTSHRAPDRVTSNDDAAKARLAPQLQDRLESGATASVGVVVTLNDGNLAAAKALLDDAHAATKSGLSLLVGRIGAQRLAKLAAIEGVVSVEPVQFKQTGQPSRRPTPRSAASRDQNAQRGPASVPETLRALRQGAAAEDLELRARSKGMDVPRREDAQLHGAWKRRLHGRGRHGCRPRRRHRLGPSRPARHVADVVRRDADDPGWDGWPKAFDPYDTLVMLAAPDFIDQGLTLVHADDGCGSCPRPRARTATCAVTFATRTGPSRNIARRRAPNDAHRTRSRQPGRSPARVRLGEPSGRLPARSSTASAPAFLVTDPNTAGVYDTVYVDLERRLRLLRREAGHEELAGVVPRHERRRLHRPLRRAALLHLGRQRRTIPGGPTTFGVERQARGRARSSRGPATSTRRSRATAR